MASRSVAGIACIDHDPSRKSQELVDLVTTSRTVLSSFAKAKTAKLGR